MPLNRPIRSLFVVILVLVFPKMSFSQLLSEDSLRLILPNATGEERIQVLNNLATVLRESEQVEAMKYSLEADSLALIFEDYSGQSRAQENIGWIYYRKGQWQKAFDYSKKAYDLAIKVEDKLQAARVMNNLGALLYEQKDFAKSIQQFKKGYELATEVDDLTTRIRSLNNVALNFVQIGELDSAESYANRSLKINKDAGYPYQSSFAHRVIGDVNLARGNYDSAQAIFSRSLEMARAQGIKSFEASILHRLGNAYLLDGELDKAEPILIYAIEHSEKNGFLDELSKSHRYLAKVYEAKGDLKKAFFHQSQFVVFNDSLLNKASSDRLALQQGIFEENLKESEVRLLKEQNENQTYRLKTSRRYAIFFALTAIVVGGMGVWLYLSNKKERSGNASLRLQQKQIEEQNQALERQSVQLLYMNETKNKLLSILGHDLKAPIEQVKSVVDLLLAGHLEPEEFNELIGMLRKDIDSVNFTLINTLKWSMAQMDGFVVRPKVFELRTVIENSLKLLSASFSAKDLAVFNQMEPTALVYADQDLIEVVIRNILNNAIKFSNAGDAVTIFSETDDQWVYWYVMDQGIGMTEEQVQLLMSDSYSITKSRLGTQKEKGSGLGLQLAKEFTRKCGGEISIDSHPGHGTKFCVKLPKAHSVHQA